MQDEKPLHPVVGAAFLLFLLQFFGCGLAVFVNLFVPFLGEMAFPIIALVLMAELAVLFVVGKAVQIVTALRATKRDAISPGRTSSGAETAPRAADDSERDSAPLNEQG